LLFKEASNPTKISIFNERSLFNVVNPLTNNLLFKETSPLTNTRLFIETSPAEVTRPVNEGATDDILEFKDASNNVLTILPPTNKLPLKDESDLTDILPFMETSPAEVIRPVNEGAASGALRANALVNPVLTMDPPTNKLLVKETSDNTESLLFMETSPLTKSLLFREASDPTKISVLKETSLLNVVNPLTNNLLFMETSPLTNNRLFMETSPAEVIRPVNEGAASGALRST
jgi:hypothetical protein